VLRAPGRIRSKAPIFSQAGGNDQMSEEVMTTVDLHPFVNQGAIRGEYGVFMNYRKG
jgi:hypothetical protein